MTSSSMGKSAGLLARRIPKALLWTAGVLAGVILILFVASFFIDEPLRRGMERGMNGALDGYRVQIGEVDFHPIGLSVTVYDLVVVQLAHPDPPVARFPRIHASVHWRELLSGNLVSDWRLDRPSLHINLEQLKNENEDEVPVEERGWQEAVYQIYPLKVNRLEIRQGDFTYIDEDPEHPLRLTNVHLTAGNIRNIHSPERAYPSPFYLEADIFDRGHGTVEGEADFLAVPHPGINARFNLQTVSLERFGAITSRANVYLAGGILSGAGRIEYSPSIKTAHLSEMTVDGLRVDYVHSAVTAEKERERARKAKEATEKAVEKQDEFVFRIDDLALTNADFGYVNEAETPKYRVFLSQAELRLQNLSNQFREGEANARLEGRFMGQGSTLVTAAFRPEKNGADFDLNLKIEGTPMIRMNDLLRAHAGIDVVAGSFSLFSEIDVEGKRIEGYIKPFFTDLDVYDPQQEKEQGLLGKLKEGVAGALGQILENPQEKVATKVDLTGTVDDPEANTWQMILQLIRNGFFKAILPGFEKELEKR